MESREGGCLCGEIRYKLNSEIRSVVNCHCNFCRAHSGGAFATYAVLAHSDLELTEGESKLSAFKAKEGRKHFCSTCGTPVFNINARYPGLCMVYLGTLDENRELSPAINIWCESMLEWVGSIKSIPSFPQSRK